MSHEDKYIKLWGGVYGGVCNSDGTLSLQGSDAYYWSQSEYDSSHAYYLRFKSNGDVNPQRGGYKYTGTSLRCVQDVQ